MFSTNFIYSWSIDDLDILFHTYKALSWSLKSLWTSVKFFLETGLAIKIVLIKTKSGFFFEDIAEYKFLTDVNKEVLQWGASLLSFFP